MNRNYISLYFIAFLILLILLACNKNNFPPVPRFSIVPNKGNTESLFLFDARQSADDNDTGKDLLVRWDWDNDGEWDTDYSLEHVQQYQYLTAGTYNIRLEVKDSKGLSAILLRELIVTDIGPLYPTVIIAPADEDVNQSLSIMLRWSCYHRDNHDITYDIYFGDNPSPPRIKSNYISTVINPGILKSGTYYYWKIVAKDDIGNVTESPLVSFSTLLVDERDGQEYDIIKIYESIWMTENLNFQSDNGSWCHSDNSNNCENFGKLYNWTAAMKACPQGWHLPSDGDWKLLEMSMLMLDSDNWGARGNNQGNMIRAGGTSGMNVLMAGTRNVEGKYSILGTDAGFWTSTGSATSAFYRYIFYQQPVIYRNTVPGEYGLSVRCVKNPN